MFNIRHYDQVIHPHSFSRGWRGRLIRALNWVRWRIEVLVQRLVVTYLAHEGGVPKAQVGVMTRLFGLDVRAERLECERTSPLLPPPEVAPRGDRYVMSGCPNQALEQASEKSAPLRPVSATEMIGKYINSRAARYAHSRRFKIVNEDAFEPVGQASKEG